MRGPRRGCGPFTRLGLAAALLIPAPLLPAQVVRDSAGVQIVSNERPVLPAARAWRIDERPILRIGGDEDAPTDSVYEFLLIMGISRMSDGRWAVGVQGSHVIRFFDAAGKFVGSAGRKGQGPGEYRQILRSQVIRGDSLFVQDLDEIEYFDADGRYVRRGASRLGMGSSGFAWPAAIMNDGSYVGFNWNDFGVPADEGTTRRLPLLRVSSTGSRVDTIAVVPVAERPPNADPYAMPPAFAPEASVAASGTTTWFGYPDRYEIREYGSTGRLVRLIRRSWEPGRVQRAERESFLRHLVEAASRDRIHPMSPAGRAEMERTLPNRPVAETYPAFAALRADPGGNLWVQRYDWHFALREPGLVRVQTMSAESKWDVFDPAGRWLCTVDLPTRFTPLEIGGDYVAGISRDEDDVERVEVYRLRKP